jgi:hypothetical protein
MIYAKATGPLRADLKKILGRDIDAPARHAISPY